MAMEDKILGTLKNVYGLIRFTAFLPRNLKTVFRIPTHESFYPEYNRKSKGKIIRENLGYLFRYREVNPYYISHGFDVENSKNQADYLAHLEFAKLRNSGNQANKRTSTGDYNYIVLLRDKYVFANYLASTIGDRCIVPTRALIIGGKALRKGEQSWVPVQDLLADEGRMVFKVIDGECADGVMLVEVKQGELFVDGVQSSRADFIASISDRKLIVQNIVQQHEALQKFKTKSVNTVRIVTVRGKSGKIGILSAFLRLSGNDTSFVDNRAKGGLGIGIDIETGKLMKYGYPHDGFGKKTDIHELSGIRFEGFQLPDWQKVTELVTIAHCQFYELQSIGWDVVLTPNGPVLLEGNDDWEIGGPQDTAGGLRSRWFELVNG